jgi:hypothetical protein
MFRHDPARVRGEVQQFHDRPAGLNFIKSHAEDSEVGTMPENLKSSIQDLRQERAEILITKPDAAKGIISTGMDQVVKPRNKQQFVAAA